MGPFIFLDVETTGIAPRHDRMIEIACVKWQDGKILDRYESVINPGVPIPYEIVLLTGITNEKAKRAPPFSEIKERVAAFIADLPIVGHNIPFDMGFLQARGVGLENAEIDTIQFARILLRKEKSYALEVLMKKHGLEPRQSHRAMADVETTIEFFEFLSKRIAEIPDPMRPLLIDLLRKTQWPGKSVFLDIFQRSVEKTKKKAPDEKKNKKNELKEWGADVTEQFLEGATILLESPATLPADILRGEPIIISYAGFAVCNEIMGRCEEMGVRAHILKESAFYLSAEKLDAVTKKETLPQEYIPFLLKILLWRGETLTGDREEISLEREEYGLFELVADSDGSGNFYKESLKTARQAAVVLMHQYTFARGLCGQLPEHKSLIILEASQLEYSFTAAFKHKYTAATLQPFFGEKAVLAFGMLGIFYERFRDPELKAREDIYGENLLVDEQSRASLEWRRFYEAVVNFPDHTIKNEFLAALYTEENSISWVTSFTDELAYIKAPVSLAQQFQKTISPFTKILLHSHALSGDGTFAFIRSIFGIGDEWENIVEKPSPESNTLFVEFHRDFPEPYSEGYFKSCVKLFGQLIAEKKGRALFLLSSKKSVEAMHQALLPQGEKSGIKLLGIGPSGGMGKALSLFLENPGNSVLFANNQILPFLHEIEHEVEVIVFQKIPFDPPSDPILSARSKQFKNGFEQYTLQRALMRFREILAEFSKGRAKICHLLDSRLLKRDYGRLFI